LNHQEIKYFLSNTPEATPTETLLKVAFSRWIIERAFEDSKTELGVGLTLLGEKCGLTFMQVVMSGRARSGTG
jgi:hypothetical protein